MKHPMVLIFMGVAGSGKSTVASLFAEKTGAVFYEGDDYHPPENIAKMSRGIPLTDADRAQWLAALRKIIERALVQKEFAVITCSALKASYREQLQGGDPAVKFIYLQGSPALIGQRLQQRPGHFMSPSLLASQFKILEPPADAITVSIELPPTEIVRTLIQRFSDRLA